MNPGLSTIIVSWNTRKDLQECLESHFKASQGISRGVETIVIDNASTDGSKKYLQELAKTKKDFHVIANDQNLGFARACNQGLETATGSFILLLNPDTIVSPDTYQMTLANLPAHLKIGIVGILTRNPDLSLQPSVWPEPHLGRMFVEAFFLHKLLPKTFRGNLLLSGYFDYQHSRPVGYVQGSFFMLTRDCYEQVGALDDQLFLFGEDLEYCMRARRKGFLTWYLHQANLIHKGNKSTEQNSPRWRIRRTVTSLYQVLYRYHSRVWLMAFCLLQISAFSLRWLTAVPRACLGEIRQQTHRQGYVPSSTRDYLFQHLLILVQLWAPNLPARLQKESQIS